MNLLDIQKNKIHKISKLKLKLKKNHFYLITISSVMYIVARIIIMVWTLTNETFMAQGCEIIVQNKVVSNIAKSFVIIWKLFQSIYKIGFKYLHYSTLVNAFC